MLSHVRNGPDEALLGRKRTLHGGGVFVDWLRNNPLATVVAPHSLRARPRATVATPLTWTEI